MRTASIRPYSSPFRGLLGLRFYSRLTARRDVDLVEELVNGAPFCRTGITNMITIRDTIRSGGSGPSALLPLSAWVYFCKGSKIPFFAQRPSRVQIVDVHDATCLSPARRSVVVPESRISNCLNMSRRLSKEDEAPSEPDSLGNIRLSRRFALPIRCLNYFKEFRTHALA